MFLKYLDELKRSVILIIPLMAALLAEMGIQLTDSVMMGYLGSNALAAGALAVSTSILIIVATIGFTAGAGIFIAQAHGGNDRQVMIRYWQHGLYVSAIISIPVMLLYANFSLIFQLLHQNPIVINLAQQYLWGELGCAFPVFAFCLFKDLGAILEKTTFIMIVAICALPLNAFLDYCFIFGKFGFPQWGMFGIGLSSTVVYWLMFLVPLVYARREPIFKAIIFSSWQRIHFKTTGEIFRIGWPMCCVYFFEAGLFSASAFMMGWVSVDAQAAHQIVIQSVDTAFMLSLGVAQVAGLRVAKYYGANDYIGMKNTVFVNTVLTIFVSILCMLLFVFATKELIFIFLKTDPVDTAHVAYLATQFFLIAACFVCFDGLKLLAMSILRGLQDTFVPMLMGLSSYWVIGIISGYLLAFKLGWQGTGIWCGLALSIIISSMLLWWRWFTQYKKHLDSAVVTNCRI